MSLRRGCWVLWLENFSEVTNRISLDSLLLVQSLWCIQVKNVYKCSFLTFLVLSFKWFFARKLKHLELKFLNGISVLHQCVKDVSFSPSDKQSPNVKARGWAYSWVGPPFPQRRLRRKSESLGKLSMRGFSVAAHFLGGKAGAKWWWLADPSAPSISSRKWWQAEKTFWLILWKKLPYHQSFLALPSK